MTTERVLLNALQQRYATVSMGARRYVCAEHVRSPASYDQPRTADMLVLDCYASTGYALHGFECKVTRSDWLRELKDTRKSHEFVRFCDTWTIVTSDKGIIKPGELPDGWGHMTLMANGKLRTVVKPSDPVDIEKGEWSRSEYARAEKGTINRGIAAMMMRAAAKETTPTRVGAAIEIARQLLREKRGTRYGKTIKGQGAGDPRWLERLREEVDALSREKSAGGGGDVQRVPLRLLRIGAMVSAWLTDYAGSVVPDEWLTPTGEALDLPPQPNEAEAA